MQHFSQRPFDKDLDSEKQAHFSEYWHNNEYFLIHLITNVDCKRAKRCESCLMEFPKHNPKQGSDLLVVHRERYMRPNTNSVGKKLKPILTIQLGRKFYCAKKNPVWYIVIHIFGKVERVIAYEEIC